jgi:PKD repeat protein
LDFGDGHTAVGASVQHQYAKAGTYAVKLTTVDRGGNVASVSQAINVLDQNCQPVNPGGGGGPGGGGNSVLQVRLQLVPQGLKSMLRSGVAMKVTSNKAASGIVTVAISRGAARQAHIKAGHGPSVVIGRGTVAKITSGTMRLRLHLSRQVTAKLKHLRHVTLTIRVALVDGNGVHRAFVAAGRY